MLHWLCTILLLVLATILTAVALCAFGYIGTVVGWDLYPSIIRSRWAIKRILKARGQNFRVHSFGATHIDPVHLCICINVDKDYERDDIYNDSELLEQFRKAILKTGYPKDSVSLLNFSVESQQTVDRDFGGNWFYARK
jgi:hypothetical protein